MRENSINFQKVNNYNNFQKVETFRDIEIEKCKFHYSKYTANLKNVDIDEKNKT